MKNPSFQLNIATVSYEGSVFTWNTQLQAPNSPSAAPQDEEGRIDCPSQELTMTSGFHCCAGSLKSLAISKSGKYLACGGNDERIRIFNMFENKTLGELSTHTGDTSFKSSPPIAINTNIGAITALEFFEDSYLISGSEDHTLCIWRVHDWVCVHILGGHKSPITSIAIHPSGKLVLSACRENVLKVWNLVQGYFLSPLPLTCSSRKNCIHSSIKSSPISGWNCHYHCPLSLLLALATSLWKSLSDRH
jgi:WD40 repeat protein